MPDPVRFPEGVYAKAEAVAHEVFDQTDDVTVVARAALDAAVAAMGFKPEFVYFRKPFSASTAPEDGLHWRLVAEWLLAKEGDDVLATG